MCIKQLSGHEALLLLLMLLLLGIRRGKGKEFRLIWNTRMFVGWVNELILFFSICLTLCLSVSPPSLPYTLSLYNCFYLSLCAGKKLILLRCIIFLRRKSEWKEEEEEERSGKVLVTRNNVEDMRAVRGRVRKLLMRLLLLFLLLQRFVDICLCIFSDCSTEVSFSLALSTAKTNFW